MGYRIYFILFGQYSSFFHDIYEDQLHISFFVLLVPLENIYTFVLVTMSSAEIMYSNNSRLTAAFVETRASAAKKLSPITLSFFNHIFQTVHRLSSRKAVAAQHCL